jgi:hypothetical protein
MELNQIERRIVSGNRMKVAADGKRFGLDVGIWFVGFGLLGAVLVLPGAKAAASPALFVIIFGGLFIGVPIALGVGVISEHLRDRRKAGHS